MNAQARQSRAGCVNKEHEVFSVYDEARGIADDIIISPLDDAKKKCLSLTQREGLG